MSETRNIVHIVYECHLTPRLYNPADFLPVLPSRVTWGPLPVEVASLPPATVSCGIVRPVQVGWAGILSQGAHPEEASSS